MWNEYETLGTLGPKYLAAQTAVRAIGTNGLPSLLRMFKARDSRLSERVDKIVPHWVPICHQEASRQHRLAEAGLRILGKDALPAAPALIELSKQGDSETRLRAIISLDSMGPSKDVLVPVLKEHLSDTDWQVQAIAATLLQRRFPEEAGTVPAKWREPTLPNSKAGETIPTNAAGFE
jgi:hypothetical protein